MHHFNQIVRRFILPVFFAAPLVVHAEPPATNPALAQWAGKSIAIHFDLDLNGDNVPTPTQTHYVTELLTEAGAKVNTWNVSKKDDLLIIGMVAPPRKLTDEEAANGLLVAENRRRSEQLAKYEQTVVQEKAAAAKVRVRAVMANEVPTLFHLTKPSDVELHKVISAYTRRHLRQILPEVDFKKNGLADVIDFLHDVSGLDIELDEAALKKVQITGDEPITMRVRDCPLEIVMDLVPDQVASERLEWISDGEKVVLASRAEAELKTKTSPAWRTVRDMLADPTPVTLPPDHLREILANHLADQKFHGNALSDCLEFLSDLSGANIYYNPAEFARAKIDLNTPVTWAMHSPTLETAITGVMHAVSPDAQLVAYCDRGYVIRIAPREEAERAVKMDAGSFLLH